MSVCDCLALWFTAAFAEYSGDVWMQNGSRYNDGTRGMSTARTAAAAADDDGAFRTRNSIWSSPSQASQSHRRYDFCFSTHARLDATESVAGSVLTLLPTRLSTTTDTLQRANANYKTAKTTCAGSSAPWEDGRSLRPGKHGGTKIMHIFNKTWRKKKII